jgi:hypothetical protein
MIAVTDSAPYFFIVEMARKSSISPSFIFLGSKDLMMKTLWPRTESKIWIWTYPSLNLLQIWRPRPISRWLAISRASISASKANNLRLENSDCREVRKILLMVVSISEEVSYYSFISACTLQVVANGATNPPISLFKAWRIVTPIYQSKHIQNIM